MQCQALVACQEASIRRGVNGAAPPQARLEGLSVVLPGRRRRRYPVDASELFFAEFQGEGA